MKAWHVTDIDNTFELSDAVHADTRGQAKVASWMFKDLELDYTDLRARRAPELDGKPLTPANLFAAGWVMMCDICAEWMFHREEVEVIEDKLVHINCRAREEAK